ncbi:MAG: hydroxymethylglutaryl-CoA lyase [Desulfobacteraceae bacterium]
MKIVEVGPRDGLQNETAPVPTDAKVAFIDTLSASGVDEIEVSAFVSARWVPQLKDACEVFDRIERRPGVVYSALVPNEQGLERALTAQADKVAIFTSASETFNRKNINTSIKGSIKRFRPVIEKAQRENLPVRGYISTAFWCAFEGRIRPEAVIEVVRMLDDIGIGEISISDTIGKASPDEVKALLDLLLPICPSHRIAVHFHDTYGRGVENVLASLSRDIRIFDSSAGGLGGCPYAPGATGNVATEKVVTALEKAGYPTGVDVRKIWQARQLLNPYLKDARRAYPEDGSPACAACEYAAGRVCCRRDQSASQAT